MINSNNQAEKRKCTEYLKKCMDECSKRLLEYLYRPSEGEMNRKFWMGMGKKPFLGQKFVDKQYSNWLWEKGKVDGEWENTVNQKNTQDKR